MNVKISPADASAHEMSAWIAQLRDEGSDGGPSDAGYSDAGYSDAGYSDAGYSDARPSGGTASDGAPGDGGPVRKIAAPAVSAGTPPAVPSGTLPAAPSGTLPAVPAGTLPAVPTGTLPAAPSGTLPAVPGTVPASDSRAPGPSTAERAVIGDQLRIPIVWCELAQCISHHTNPAALGEADIRARALSAGWRFDRLGRLTCPECQQSSPWFWPAHPVALQDREAAAIMVALMAAHHRRNGADHTAEVAHETLIPPVRPAASTPQNQWIRGRHRK